MKCKHILLIFCLCLLLSGCSTAKDDAAPPSPTAPPAVSYRQSQLVTVLDQQFSTMPSVIALGHGKILISDSNYEASTTTLSVYDLAAQQATFTTTLDYYGIPYAADSETIAMLSYADDSFYLLNHDLEQLQVFSPEDITGKFDFSGRKYYYTEKEALYAQDLSSGNVELVSIPGGMSVCTLTDIDAAGELMLQLYPDAFTTHSVFAVWKPGSEQFRFLGDADIQPRFHNDFLSYVQFDTEDFSPVTCWGTIQAGSITLRELAANDLGLRNGFPQPIPGSSYCFFSEDDPESGNAPSRCSLALLGEDVKLWNLTEAGIPGDVLAPMYLPEADLLLFSHFGQGHGSIYLLDPTLLPDPRIFPCKTGNSQDAVSQTILAECQSVPEPLSAEYDEVRSKADWLEKNFGVRILLSRQCNKLQENMDYPFQDTAQIPQEIQTISDALAKLEQAMELYPDDFFQQFRTKNGGGGVCLLLTGPIENDFSIIGFAGTHRNWYTVTLDISYDHEGLIAAFCHEMWHATESFAYDKCDAFAILEQWEQANPDGFTYSNDRTQYTAMEYTYLMGSTEPYFVDGYATTVATEDRARLMEYLMAYPDCAIDLARSPAMQKKIQILCQVIQESFDESNWGELRWAKYLQ